MNHDPIRLIVILIIINHHQADQLIRQNVVHYNNNNNNNYYYYYYHCCNTDIQTITDYHCHYYHYHCHYHYHYHSVQSLIIINKFTSALVHVIMIIIISGIKSSQISNYLNSWNSCPNWYVKFCITIIRNHSYHPLTIDHDHSLWTSSSGQWESSVVSSISSIIPFFYVRTIWYYDYDSLWFMIVITAELTGWLTTTI